MQTIDYQSANLYKSDRKKMIEIAKNFLLILGMAALNWLVPIRDFVLVTLLLVFFDLGTGLQAARKRGETIHSKGLRRTITKFAMYVAAIIGANAVQTVYFPQFPMVFAISAFIAATELLSVLENVGTVTGTNVAGVIRDKLLSAAKKDDK